MASANPAGVDRRDDCLRELLDATETLWAAIEAGEGHAIWLATLERRERAIASLERALEADGAEAQALSAVGRSRLHRIGELDARLIAEGSEALVRLQRERLELSRRRKAVHAHGIHEREPARAVALKA